MGDILCIELNLTSFSTETPWCVPFVQNVGFNGQLKT